MINLLIALMLLAAVCVFFAMWVKLLGNSLGRQRRLAVAAGVAIIAIFAAALFVAIRYDSGHKSF